MDEAITPEFRKNGYSYIFGISGQIIKVMNEVSLPCYHLRTLQHFSKMLQDLKMSRRIYVISSIKGTLKKKKSCIWRLAIDVLFTPGCILIIPTSRPGKHSCVFQTIMWEAALCFTKRLSAIMTFLYLVLEMCLPVDSGGAMQLWISNQNT